MKINYIYANFAIEAYAHFSDFWKDIQISIQKQKSI